MLGTAAGGILVAAIGSGWALAFDAATYFLGAVFLLGLRLPHTLTMTQQTSSVSSAKAGTPSAAGRGSAIVVQFAFVNAASVGDWPCSARSSQTRSWAALPRGG